jgi:DNA-binding PadR family transcriptional regulator
VGGGTGTPVLTCISVSDISAIDIAFYPRRSSMKRNQLSEELQQLLPLTPAVFFVLLSLADGEKHGYAIMQEMATPSGGKFRMGPGTLYTTLQRLLDLALIEEVRRTGAAVGRESRRRYYQLTGSGKVLLEDEISRMDSVVRLARRKKLVPRTVE